MTWLAGWAAVAPGWLSRHREVLLYLAPSLLLAGFIRALAARHPLFFLLKLPGTICHELAHFGAGWLTAARPRSLTVVPCRAGQGWELGSVMLTRLRWYNAAPSALAPLLLIALPFLLAAWRTRPGWRVEPLDLALAFFIAPQFLACWPSAADWRIAARSWPLLPLAAAAGWWWATRR